jgi:molybdopterin converting factor small subunit
MNTVVIRIPTPLRSYTQGVDEVRVQGSTVKEVLEALGAAHDGVLARVLSPDGEPRQFVNIYLGSQNVRALDGLQTPVKDGDVVSIIPAVAGGDDDACKRPQTG